MPPAPRWSLSEGIPMRKPYRTPKLLARGEVVATTCTTNAGCGDPLVNFECMTSGSIGFNL